MAERTMLLQRSATNSDRLSAAAAAWRCRWPSRCSKTISEHTDADADAISEIKLEFRVDSWHEFLLEWPTSTASVEREKKSEWCKKNDETPNNRPKTRLGTETDAKRPKQTETEAVRGSEGLTTIKHKDGKNNRFRVEGARVTETDTFGGREDKRE